MLLYESPIAKQDVVEAKPLMGCERLSWEAKAGRPRVDPLPGALQLVCVLGGANGLRFLATCLE